MVHTQHPKNNIIIFTRYPVPGQVKTRLAPTLGEEGAAILHRKLTEHIVQQTLPVTSQADYSLTIYYTGGSHGQMTNWLGDSLPMIQQTGKGLGERLLNSFLTSRKSSAEKTIIIGSDCPEIDTATLKKGFESLDNHDLVIGPTFDGGYYLIGLHHLVTLSPLKSLFTSIAWGSDGVYEQTIARARNSGLNYTLLPMLSDIDRPEDLEHFSYNSHA